MLAIKAAHPFSPYRTRTFFSLYSFPSFFFFSLRIPRRPHNHPTNYRYRHNNKSKMYAYLSLALFAIAATAAPSVPHPQGDPFNTFPFNPSGGVGSLEMDSSPKNDPGNDLPYGLGKGATGAEVASSALHVHAAQSTPASSMMDTPDQNFEAPMEEMPLPQMPDGTEMPMSSAEVESPSIPESSMVPESSSMATMAKSEPKPTHKAEHEHKHESMTSHEPKMKPTATHAAPMHDITVVETQLQVPTTHATHAVMTMVTHPAKAASIHHKHMKLAASSSSSDVASDSSSSATPTPTPSAAAAGLSSLLNGVPVVGPMLGNLGGLLGGGGA